MKKALSIAGKILTILIAVFSVGVMIFTIVSVNTIGKDAALFGYKPYIVTSNSMQDTFQAGDLTVSKQVDPATLEPGDIVTFRSIDPVNYGQVVTHKIKSITTYEGEPAFVTYGTATGVEDAYPVPFSQVLGQYQFRLPGMGNFFYFLKSTAGYVTVILLPFLILIILQAVKFFKLVGQYKEEQRAELNTERAQLQAEREETQRMKQELERLRAQLGENAPPKTEPEASKAQPKAPMTEPEAPKPQEASPQEKTKAETQTAQEPSQPEEESIDDIIRWINEMERDGQ